MSCLSLHLSRLVKQGRFVPAEERRLLAAYEFEVSRGLGDAEAQLRVIDDHLAGLRAELARVEGDAAGAWEKARPEEVPEPDEKLGGKISPNGQGGAERASGSVAPAEWGANNVLVSRERAAELRERLKKKLGQLNSGVDPEMLAIGVELAAFHIEAGARRFGDFARAIAQDLGVSVESLRPYLRAWYNGARDMIEDHGLSVEGTDDAEAVKGEVKRLFEPAKATSDKGSDKTIGEPTPQPSPGVPGERAKEPVHALAGDLAGGRRFASIVEARKRVGELTGETIEPGTVAAKRADEMIEAAGVLAARGIVAEGLPESETFDRLADLADRLPGLNTRTSTSVEQQAYSTPLPIAYVASRRADIGGEVMTYEPTAGNGALLIEANPKWSIANELNPERRAVLAEQGFKPWDKDASTLDLGAPVRRVIANPPFGVVKDDNGESRVFEITPQYRTTEIDHAIALNALKAMSDDGRAVLIVGGPAKTLSDAGRSDAYNGKAKRAFYYTLYNEYNVTDHFTVSGDLYRKQGAAWPVDVIVIEGRGKSARALPAVDLPRIINSLEELKRELPTERSESNRSENRRAGADAVASGTEPSGSEGADAAAGEPAGRGGAGARPADGDGAGIRGGAGGGAAATGPERDSVADKPAQELPIGGRTGVGFDSGRGVDAEQRPYSGKQPVPTVRSATVGVGDVVEAGRLRYEVVSVPENPSSQPVKIRLVGAMHNDGQWYDVKPGQKVQSRDVGKFIYGFGGMVPTSKTPAVEPSATGPQSGQDGVPTRSVGTSAKAEKPAVTSSFQATYQPASQARSVGTLVPVNMRDAVARALGRVVERHGPVDAYVAKELGYAEQDLPNYFSAEQVDALALALDNLARGKGFIIGDQTGVGKGRFVAGIIRYAMRNGLAPIFVTEKPNLYGDMLRDLNDIGMPDVRPVVTNAGFAIPMDDDANAWYDAAEAAKARGEKPPAPFGKFLKTPNGSSHAAQLRQLMEKRSLGEYDVIFTTYNQMQTVKGERTQRMDFLEQFAAGGVVIFDESHNAGGNEVRTFKREKQQGADDSTKTGRAYLARQLVSLAQGVVYSSATYAKRPEVMDLYSKTDMGMGFAKPSELSAALASGGVPLQQVVASMLAEAGQYIRREKSFDGISYETVSAAVDRGFAENAATIMRDIMRFDKLKKAAIAGLDKDLKADARKLSADRSTGGAGAVSTNFTSVMHNLIGQMLLTLKVQPTLDEALAALKRGEKPVIALANTMGSAIQEYADEVGLKPGDAIALNFGDLMKRYLQKSRRVIEGDAFGKKTSRELTDQELGPTAVKFYRETLKKIDKMGFGEVPVSPIDALRQGLAKEGYRVGEITGRTAIVDYSGAMPVFRRRKAEEVSTAGKRKTIQDFNSGKLDAVILNQSGATGLSLHASEKFQDRRPRRMLITQAELNIDTHMQMLGRVNRTGQVVLPSYGQLVADIPAEKRPASILAKKMAGLNANTTANRSSAVTAKDVPDFMNQYGDQVAAAVMYENDEWHEALGKPLNLNPEGDGYETEGAIRKVTGRIPVLPLKQQEEVYAAIEDAYNELIETLDRMGENDLEAKTFDLDAVTKAKTEAVPARGETDSPFGGAVTAETVNVKFQGKPLTLDQVAQEIGRGIGFKMPKDAGLSAELGAARDKHYAALLDRTREDYRAYRETVEAAYPDADTDDKVRKARDAELAKNDQRMAKVEALLTEFKPGQGVRYLSAGGPVYGVVGKVERKGKTKNPVALSDWKVTIYVAEPWRQFTTTLPRLNFQAQGQTLALERGLMSADPAAVRKAFEEGQSTTREDRTILTGNLLAGFGDFRQGRILNFTRRGGEVAQGILMPRSFDLAEEQDARPVVFDEPGQVRAFAEALPIAWQLDSADGAVRLTGVGTRGLSLSVPKSKAEGGRYYLNQPLREALGMDFVSAPGGVMAARNFDVGRLDRVLGVLYGMGVRLQAEGNKETARKVTGKAAAGGKDRGEEARYSTVSEDILPALREAPSTEASLVAELARSGFARDIKKLMRAGLVTIQPSRQAPPGTPRTVSALWSLSRHTAILYHDRIPQGKAPGKVAHELTHGTLRPYLDAILGPEAYGRVTAEFERLLRDRNTWAEKAERRARWALDSRRREADLARRLYQLVPGEETRGEYRARLRRVILERKWLADERLAYMLEEYVNATEEQRRSLSGRVKLFFRELFAAVRMAFYRSPFYQAAQRAGIKMELTPADIAALVRAAVEWRARQAGLPGQAGENRASDDSAGPLLAPNGKPSKLNAMQWRQVRTPEFLAWFGDWENNPSDRVLENGLPRVMYHGKAGDDVLESISPNKPFFLAYDPDVAAHYAGAEGDWFEPGQWPSDEEFIERWESRRAPVGAKVYPFFVAGKVLDVGDTVEDAASVLGLSPDKYDNIVHIVTSEKAIKAAKEKGYSAIRFGGDSLPLEYGDESHETLMVFEADKIKSAVGNTGAFSAENPDIRFSDDGEEPPPQPSPGVPGEGAKPRLAPNGKPSKLNRVQWAQVRTPEFKAWFGDWEHDPANASKVVDENGEPLVVYHGTGKEFTEFDPDFVGSAIGNQEGVEYDKGFFFTTDKSEAEYAAEQAAYNLDGMEKVIEVFLNLREPYVFNTKSKEPSVYYDQIADRVMLAAEDAESDGISLFGKTKTTFIAFEPEQIKSATGNTGAFSPDNPDIRYSDDGEEPPPQPSPAGAGEGVTPGYPNAAPRLERNLKAVLRTDPKGQGKGFLKSLRPLALQLLGRRQLVDVYQDDVPALRGYSDLVQAYGADANKIQTEADRLAQDWGRLAKKVADALADTMHFDTLHQVSGAWARYRPKWDAESAAADFREELGAALKEKRRLDALIKSTGGNLSGHQIKEDYWRQWQDIGKQVERMSKPWAEKSRVKQRLAEERQRKADYAKSRARFLALPKEAQAIYTQAAGMYDAQWKAVEQALVERIERSDAAESEKRKIIDKLRLAFRKQLPEVYFPLHRAGDYVVVVKNADGTNEFVGFAESPNAAEALRREMLARYGKTDKQVMPVAKKKERSAQDMVSGRFVSEVLGLIGEAGGGPQTEALREQVMQLYLENLPDLSWAKHEIHRKKVPGYSADARRAFASHMFHGAAHLARIRYADRLEKALDLAQTQVDGRWRDTAWQEQHPEWDAVRAQEVVSEMRKRHDILMNPPNTPLANLLTSAGFVWFMGLSPASALVNLTQTPMVAFPVLGARFGFRKAWRALTAASTDAAKALGGGGWLKDEQAIMARLKVVLPADEYRAIEQGVNEGHITVTLAHDLAGVAQGANRNPRLEAAMKAASVMFHQAEMLNRISTVLAGYRMAKAAVDPEAGYDTAAYAKAIELNYESHFDYAAANRPRAMQAPLLRVVLQFKQYAQNMLWLMGKNAYEGLIADENFLPGADKAARKREARRTLAGLMAMHALVAGAFGLPFVTTLLAAASWAGSDDDEPWDAEVALRNFLADVFGERVGEALVHGAPRLARDVLPLDVSSRVGLDHLLLPDVQEGLEGDKWYQAATVAALGPVFGGMFVNLAKGLDTIAGGDWLRGLEEMSPKVLKDLLKAGRYAQEGVKDKTGIQVLDEVGAGETAGQALGFSPARVLEAYESRGAVYSLDRKLSKRRAELMDGYARAAMAGEDTAEALADIRAFNAANPEERINRKALVRSVRQRRLRIDRAEGGVYLPRGRQGLREEGRFFGE